MSERENERIESVRHCHKSNRDIFICFDTFGDASHTPVVLIPGLGTQLSCWRPRFCEQIAAKGFYVIRMDNRDIGHSIHLDNMRAPNPILLKAKAMYRQLSPEEVPYTLKDMAEDVVALVKKLGFNSAILVGASMGGMIAQEAALNWPEHVRGLVLIMTTAGGASQTEASLGVQLKLLRSPPEDPEGKVKHGVWLFREIGGKKHFDEKMVEAYIRLAHARSTYRGGILRHIAAIQQGNRAGRIHLLPTLKTPTVIVHGAEDILVPVANAHAIGKAISGSELVIVPDMGHDLAPPGWPFMIDAVARVEEKAKEAGVGAATGGE